VEQVKKGPDWELFRPAYEAWQAELIDTGDERASKKAKKDSEPPARFDPGVSVPPEHPDADDDDDKPGSSAGRRTMSKGYRK
jgi:hypothetical protein